MNRHKLTAPYMLLLSFLIAATISCNSGQTEERFILFDQYYTFEPASLMQSLRNGNLNTLVPVNEDPGLLPVEQQIAVDWLQADYFYIVNTLYENVLGKTLQGWNLNSMDFRLGCSKIQNGFQNGRFEFFKIVKEKEKESRVSRFIDLDPRGNFVHIKESEYYPTLGEWEVIDIEKLTVSADLALQIAESNGGSEKRLSVGNVCNISLGLFPDNASYKGWEVIYTRSDDRTEIFRIQIEPITGEIQVP